MATPRRRAPATTPEARENQLISAAVNLAEEQLLNGTASSQVITHYLKMSTGRERLERSKLEYETELLKARRDAIASEDHRAELLDKAIGMFSQYRGNGLGGDDDNDH